MSIEKQTELVMTFDQHAAQVKEETLSLKLLNWASASPDNKILIVDTDIGPQPIAFVVR